MLDGGEGYASKPTASLATWPGEPLTVVAMGPDGQGNPTGAVAAITHANYNYKNYYVDNVTPQQVTFAGGGTPTRAATAQALMLNNTWPFMSYYYAHNLRLTVVGTDGVTPVAGAAVTIADSGGHQVFPAIPGAVGTDGGSLVPTVTDASGRIGVTADIPKIPLPHKLVTAGNSATKTNNSLAVGTSDLDGSAAVMTQGQVTTTDVSGYTLTITAPGYQTYTRTLASTGPLTLTAQLTPSS